MVNAKSLLDTKSSLYEKIEKRYNEHVLQKEKKASGKAKFIKNAETTSKARSVLCFNFQKVLPLPKSETNAFYYKRKVGVNNFTTYDIGRYESNCYCYDENVGHKGSCEVGSFLYHYFQEKEKLNIEQFSKNSDNYGGQNRNRFVFYLYVYAASTLEIDIIHTFLECGHTQNEGDSVHVLIENKSKKPDIFTPEMWYKIIENAKKSTKNPYSVVRVT